MNVKQARLFEKAIGSFSVQTCTYPYVCTIQGHATRIYLRVMTSRLSSNSCIIKNKNLHCKRKKMCGRVLPFLECTWESFPFLCFIGLHSKLLCGVWAKWSRNSMSKCAWPGLPHVWWIPKSAKGSERLAGSIWEADTTAKPKSKSYST